MPPETSRGEDFGDMAQLPKSPIRNKPVDLQPIPATSTFQQQPHLTSPSGKKKKRRVLFEYVIHNNNYFIT